MTATKTAIKTVNVFGDKIQIRMVGSMWVSPCNGRQHPEARDAMRGELERYFTECGEDTECDEVMDQIEWYLDQIS